MDTLVIHLQDSSTEELKLIYEGCKALGSIERISKWIPRQELIAKINEAKNIIMLGHGSPHGLLNIDWSAKGSSAYIVDESIVPYLKGKNNYAIWCYAREFFASTGLNGFCSSMWISEKSEAAWQGITGYSQEYIRFECAKLSMRMHRLFDEGVPGEEWPQILRDWDDQHTEVTDFNYNGLAYFDGSQSVKRGKKFSTDCVSSDKDPDNQYYVPKRKLNYAALYKNDDDEVEVIDTKNDPLYKDFNKGSESSLVSDRTLDAEEAGDNILSLPFYPEDAEDLPYWEESPFDTINDHCAQPQVGSTDNPYIFDFGEDEPQPKKTTKAKTTKSKTTKGNGKTKK